MEALLQNARYSIRMLRKSPGFTAAALLTLALAIGANTAIFSVVDAVVLRPLPYSDPDRLILVKEWIPQATPDPIPVSAPDVIQFQRQNSVFDGVAAFSGAQFDLSGENEPQRVTAERVNFNLFPLLGVQPVMGRGFTESEDQPGHQVAVLSYGLWRSRFAGDPNVIGRTLKLDRRSYTVIGVMPHDLIFPLPGMDQGEAADLFVPMAFTHDDLSRVPPRSHAAASRSTLLPTLLLALLRAAPSTAGSDCEWKHEVGAGGNWIRDCGFPRSHATAQDVALRGEAHEPRSPRQRCNAARGRGAACQLRAGAPCSEGGSHGGTALRVGGD